VKGTRARRNPGSQNEAVHRSHGDCSLSFRIVGGERFLEKRLRGALSSVAPVPFPVTKLNSVLRRDAVCRNRRAIGSRATLRQWPAVVYRGLARDPSSPRLLPHLWASGPAGRPSVKAIHGGGDRGYSARFDGQTGPEGISRRGLVDLGGSGAN
jgi:hypothetical protein